MAHRVDVDEGENTGRPHRQTSQAGDVIDSEVAGNVVARRICVKEREKQTDVTLVIVMDYEAVGVS